MKGACANCGVAICSDHPLLGSDVLNDLWPYCSTVCKAGGEVREALGQKRCEACYAVIPLRGGLASLPSDDPQVPGVACSPDCYALMELREQIAPSIDP